MPRALKALINRCTSYPSIRVCESGSHRRDTFIVNNLTVGGGGECGECGECGGDGGGGGGGANSANSGGGSNIGGGGGGVT